MNPRDLFFYGGIAALILLFYWAGKSDSRELKILVVILGYIIISFMGH